MLSYLIELALVLTTCLDGWPGGRVALEEWKLRLTSAKFEVEVEAELGNIANHDIPGRQAGGLGSSYLYFMTLADLEKVASNANSTSEHSLRNPVILRIFYVKNPVLLTENEGRRVEDWLKES